MTRSTETLFTEPSEVYFVLRCACSLTSSALRGDHSVCPPSARIGGASKDQSGNARRLAVHMKEI